MREGTEVLTERNRSLSWMERECEWQLRLEGEGEGGRGDREHELLWRPGGVAGELILRMCGVQ